jgi:hypothetical protein
MDLATTQPPTNSCKPSKTLVRPAAWPGWVSDRAEMGLGLEGTQLEQNNSLLSLRTSNSKPHSLDAPP